MMVSGPNLNAKKIFAVISAGLVTAGLVLSFQNCGSTNFSSAVLRGQVTPANYASIASAIGSQGDNTSGYDILIVAGQSNAVGYGCGPATQVSNSQDSRILQVDPDGNVIPAPSDEKLFFNPGRLNGIGFGLTVARLYAQQLTSQRKLIIVPVAYGGTSLMQWDDANDLVTFGGGIADSTQLWDKMVSRTQKALTYQGLNNRVVGLLWHQGENDYSTIKGVTGTHGVLHPWIPIVDTYESRFRNFIRYFRSSFANGAQLPIVIGELGSFWNIADDPDPNSAVLNSFNSMLARVAATEGNMAIASSTGLVSNAVDSCSLMGATPDALHFSSSSQVEFGKRYFAQYLNLQSIPSATVSQPSLALRLSGVGVSQIPDGLAMSCDYFNPDAIKNLSESTIVWLATIQPSGLTLHENYFVARQQGYNGAFGNGQHNAWLAQNPSLAAPFSSAVQALANSPNAPYATFAAHHVAKRAAGYRGLFLCGGGACYEQGQCDDLGRRK